MPTRDDLGSGPTRRSVLRAAGTVVMFGPVASCRRGTPPTPAPAASPAPVPEPMTATFPPPIEEPRLRVRIARRSAAAPPVAVATETPWIELIRIGDEDAREPVVVMRSPVWCALDEAGWSLHDEQGFRAQVSGRTTIELRPIRPEDGDQPAPVMRLETQAYPGFLRLVPRGDEGDAFDVVNHVRLEAYLPGVLARELYPHWDDATFAAQAIAARSFACSEHRQRRRRSYDVTNTTRSQVYAGVVDLVHAANAVRTTRGMVLVDGPDLVPGYYSASCGGRAACATDAIGPHPANALAALRGGARPDDCTSAPRYAWTRERTLEDTRRRLARHGRRQGPTALATLGPPTAIVVAGANPHGRPVNYRIEDAKGEHAHISSSDLRRALDHEEPGQRLWSDYLAVSIDGDRVTIEGRGHGHGVGLCQHGAQNLAQRGATWAEILAWYYPGAHLHRAYA